MAAEKDIVDTVLEYIAPDKRAAARSLVTRLTQRIVRTIGQSRNWVWRKESQDLPVDGSNPVYTLDANCAVISRNGAAPIDASGDPAGKPYVFMTEHNYHIRRATNDTRTNPRFYIPLKKRTAAKELQVRFWPNITTTARIWWFRKVSSQDITYITNEIMLVTGVLSLLPRNLFDEAPRFKRDFAEQLQVETQSDRIAMSDQVAYTRSRPIRFDSTS